MKISDFLRKSWLKLNSFRDLSRGINIEVDKFAWKFYAQRWPLRIIRVYIWFKYMNFTYQIRIRLENHWIENTAFLCNGASKIFCFEEVTCRCFQFIGITQADLSKKFTEHDKEPFKFL